MRAVTANAEGKMQNCSSSSALLVVMVKCAVFFPVLFYQQDFLCADRYTEQPGDPGRSKSRGCG